MVFILGVINMDAKYISEKLKLIENIGDSDPEVSHSLEDNLYKEVLEAIAKGPENPSELAKEVLKVSELNFTRWYA